MAQFLNAINDGRTLLGSVTATASPYIVFPNTLFNSAFPYYLLSWSNLGIGANQTTAAVGWQWATGGGSPTYQTTTNNFVVNQSYVGGTAASYALATPGIVATDQVQLMNQGSTYAIQTDLFDGNILLSFMNANLKPRIRFGVTYQGIPTGGNTGLTQTFGLGQNTTAGIYTSGRLVFNAGHGSVGTTYNFAAGGVVDVYGLMLPVGVY